MTAAPLQSPPSHYQAWQWQGSADPAALQLGDVAREPLASGQVWVRNAVIGLNPVDWKVLSGHLVDWQPGKVPGVDGAGVVVAVAEDVPAHWLGRRVAYHQNLAAPGSFAQYTPLPAQVLLPIPDAMDWATAASVPCPALTAWLAMEKLPLRPGQHLLIAGAGGAVGHYLTQLASARGVAVTVMSHPRHAQRLQALGARAHLDGPLEGTLPASQQQHFHAVIDAVGALHATRLVPGLKANGHLLCIEGRLPEWPNPPFGRALSLHEVALGALHEHGDAEDWALLARDGQRLLEQIACRRLKPETHLSRPFEALPTLLKSLQQRDFSGKPLITVSS